MSRIAGKTVLITGGASGIGKLMGRKLLEEGAAHLVVWDVQAHAMEQLATELAGADGRVSTYLVDLANPERIRAAVEDMEAAGVAVDIVVNNAGVVTGRTFVEHSSQEIARTMDVNALAPMYVARAFLPGMLARRSGHIVNIASAAGLVANPKMSVYCASKWAIVGWSDSLRIEMEQEKTGVSITTVTPYYIDTGMFDGVRSPFIPILKPAYVSDRIIAAIKSDRIFLRLPWIVNLVPLLRGILPMRWFDKIGGQWLGIYHSMDDFRGRR
ncbi:SDR family NAD(P)-dependent oxidoreductase [Stenotrophomonas maltophilia]|uniref:SDR family oxidoreductase n=1 Tax=Stenotrophomonas TaxID=40323 RepID=UPI00066C029C|nr:MULTISPECIES: SDR family oxidoreductase [Stenotrophomonas]MBA0395577.1 SDR family NAD(P)-dependent oxidoreductase [Stenotrophomonas maltophilia]